MLEVDYWMRFWLDEVAFLQSGVFARTTGTSSGEGNDTTFWMARE